MGNRVDKIQAINAARRLLAREPVILDTQTTGLGDEAEVWEVAIIDHTGQVLLDTRVKPVYGIPNEVTQIHGIADSDVSNAPSLAAVLDNGVARTLRSATIGIWNANHDRRVLRQSGAALARFDIVSLAMVVQAVCVMKMYAGFYGEWSDLLGDYAWQSLAAAAEQCGLEWNGVARSALADAHMTLQVLRHMAGREKHIV